MLTLSSTVTAKLLRCLARSSAERSHQPSQAMDSAVKAAIGDSQADGAAGLLAIDSTGLCLAASGKLQEAAAGRLAVVAEAARRVQPDAPRPPVLVLETENSVCLVTGSGPITTALLREKP